MNCDGVRLRGAHRGRRGMDGEGVRLRGADRGRRGMDGDDMGLADNGFRHDTIL